MEYNAEQRRQQILELLSEKGKVRVTELAHLFRISEVTIRIDLADLESRGLLSRVHGGAVSSYKNYYSMNFNQRSGTNEAEKRAIAEYVASTIKDNDTIMMNAGTTTLFVLRALNARQNIHIVTNSVAIALEASDNPNFNVMLLGGLVNTKYQFTYGDDALRQLGTYHADKLILSVDGIHGQDGLTTYYNQEAEICRLMIRQASSVLVTADYTKIGRTALSSIAPIAVADCLITNNKANRDELEIIQNEGLQIVTV